jgi:hypothetical protein
VESSMLDHKMVFFYSKDSVMYFSMLKVSL